MSQRALNPELPKRALSWVIWTGITALGAFALAGIALNRNEPVSAAWLVTAAICVYLIAYRFYGKFIAEKVVQLDNTRMTCLFHAANVAESIPQRHAECG